MVLLSNPCYRLSQQHDEQRATSNGSALLRLKIFPRYKQSLYISQNSGRLPLQPGRSGADDTFLLNQRPLCLIFLQLVPPLDMLDNDFQVLIEWLLIPSAAVTGSIEPYERFQL